MKRCQIVHCDEYEGQTNESVEAEPRRQPFDVLNLVLNGRTKGVEESQPIVDAVVVCRHNDERRRLKHRVSDIFNTVGIFTCEKLGLDDDVDSERKPCVTHL